MELRHLRYMLALAEHRSFTRAAHAVHVTQSTLSHQIRQLELEVGRDLFDRSGREVLLTEAGEALLPGVRRALDELNGAIRAVKQQDDDPRIQLRVLVGARVCARRVLAPVVAQQSGPDPAVLAQIQEVYAIAMPERLQAEGGRFDIVLGDVQHLPAGWRFEPLYFEEIGLLTPQSHRFAGRRRVRMAELHGEALVLTTPPEPTRLSVDRALAQVQAYPRVIAKLNVVEAVFEMAALHCAPTITSRNHYPAIPDMIFVPLEDPVPMRTIGFMWREDADPTPAARNLAERIRKRVRSYAAANDGDFTIRACSPQTPATAAPEVGSARVSGPRR